MHLSDLVPRRCRRRVRRRSSGGETRSETSNLQFLNDFSESGTPGDSTVVTTATRHPGPHTIDGHCGRGACSHASHGSNGNSRSRHTNRSQPMFHIRIAALSSLAFRLGRQAPTCWKILNQKTVEEAELNEVDWGMQGEKKNKQKKQKKTPLSLI